MTEKIAEVETCPCQFEGREEERRARADFLHQYGDELPDEVITQMVSDALWGAWVTKCNCEDPKEIVAAAHWKPSDWYLCTVRGLAVKEDWRGKRLASETVAEVTEKASHDPVCQVLAADVTHDNVASIRSLSRSGFEPTVEFCWAEGQKPVGLLHLVRFKPTKDKSCERI